MAVLCPRVCAVQVLCLAEQVYFTRQAEEVLRGDPSAAPAGLRALRERLMAQLAAYTSHDLSSEPLLQVRAGGGGGGVVGAARGRGVWVGLCGGSAWVREGKEGRAQGCVAGGVATTWVYALLFSITSRGVGCCARLPCVRAPLHGACGRPFAT